MRARHEGNTGWIGAMGLIHGACQMTKYYMVAECK